MEVIVGEVNSQFELVSLHAEPSVPRWLAARLASPGVPRSFFEDQYSALEIARLRVEGELELVAFGAGNFQEQYCVDLETGAVVVIDRYSEIHPVNTSLDQFSDCLRVVVESWPDWKTVSYPEDCERIAATMEESIRRIDEEALLYDSEGHWESFLAEVRIGSYI